MRTQRAGLGSKSFDKEQNSGKGVPGGDGRYESGLKKWSENCHSLSEETFVEETLSGTG